MYSPFGHSLSRTHRRSLPFQTNPLGHPQPGSRQAKVQMEDFRMFVHTVHIDGRFYCWDMLKKLTIYISKMFWTSSSICRECCHEDLKPLIISLKAFALTGLERNNKPKKQTNKGCMHFDQV